jgi:hypothetical protein
MALNFYYKKFIHWVQQQQRQKWRSTDETLPKQLKAVMFPRVKKFHYRGRFPWRFCVRFRVRDCAAIPVWHNSAQSETQKRIDFAFLREKRTQWKRTLRRHSLLITNAARKMYSGLLSAGFIQQQQALPSLPPLT